MPGPSNGATGPSRMQAQQSTEIWVFLVTWVFMDSMDHSTHEMEYQTQVPDWPDFGNYWEEYTCLFL